MKLLMPNAQNKEGDGVASCVMWRDWCAADTLKSLKTPWKFLSFHFFAKEKYGHGFVLINLVEPRLTYSWIS